MNSLNCPASQIRPDNVIVYKIDYGMMTLSFIEVECDDQCYPQKWCYDQDYNFELMLTYSCS